MCIAMCRLHIGLLKKVLRLPMSFFDSQPVGRLINRFSRDVESLDTSLGNAVQSFTNCLVSVVGAMLVVVFVTPGVLIGVVPLGFLYRRVQVCHLEARRQVGIFANILGARKYQVSSRSSPWQIRLRIQQHAMGGRDNCGWRAGSLCLLVSAPAWNDLADKCGYSGVFQKR